MMSNLVSRTLYLLVFAILLSACAPATPTLQAEAIYTQAAHTMEARLTLSAGETAVALLTQMAHTPTPAPVLPTLPPLLPTFTSQPPTPTVTPIPPSPTPGVCDQASFVEHVTVPDYATFAPGASFIKTWRVRNVGVCTWTPAYALVFASGDDLGAPSVVGLTGTVHPGESVDISASFTAPSEPGFYEGRWLLRNANNQMIEILSGDQDTLWVRIQVVSLSPSPDFAYDMAANACEARWRSGSGTLGCPGRPDDEDGAAMQLTQPNLESRQEDERAIWVRPNRGSNGSITGEFPAYRIRDGDHFVAEIGCLRDNPRCNLTFRLDYRTLNGTLWNLGAWDEKYDGLTTDIDIDLSALAGETVQFILGMTNHGNYADADGFWFVPHIENVVPTSQLVLNWRRQGGLQNLCDDLRIYLTGRRFGEARATDCRDNNRELGRATLSDQELDRVLEWVDRYSAFDGEVYLASNDDPVTSYLVFQGRGRSEALGNDINLISSFAQSLFNSLSQ